MFIETFLKIGPLDDYIRTLTGWSKVIKNAWTIQIYYIAHLQDLVKSGS